MRAQPFFTLALGVFVLTGLLLINELFFKYTFETSYFAWYRSHGALIGLALSAFTLFWGNLKNHTGLISPHPWDYLGSCLQLVGLPIFILGTHLKTENRGSRNVAFIDVLISAVLIIVLTLVLLIWLIVAAPIQYFVYLISASPGRVFAASKATVLGRFKGSSLEIMQTRSSKPDDEDWSNFDIKDKPVASANLFSALFFLILNSLPLAN